MKTIPLTQGLTAIVDDDDYERVSQFNWHHHGHGRAARTVRVGVNKRKTEFLHNFIMPPVSGFYIDHKNCKPLDNRKENLRLATALDNARNTLRRRDNTSGFKGVSFKKEFGLFFSRVQVAGKRIHLGYFPTAEKAYKAYCDAVPKYHGEFARAA